GLLGRIRAWPLAAAIVIVLCAATASVAAAVPSNFWGVAPQAIPTAEQFQRLKLGGVDSVRIPVDWGAIQASAGGGYNWNATHELVGGAAGAGLEVFPFLTGAPSWAVPSAVVNRAAHSFAPLSLPVRIGKEKTGWTEFVTAAVRRYGNEGTFWAAH